MDTEIYILPVKEEPQPRIRPWPRHSVGFTMEIDFYNFLKSSNITVGVPELADWHYLPINWSYWLLNHDYGRNGREEMQKYIDSVIIDDSKTFTVSEAGGLPASFNIGRMLVFSANQMTNGETPIPLMTLPHKFPEVFPDKKWLASFVGSMNHPIRKEMKEVLKDRGDVLIMESKKGEELFVNTIMSSYSSLCPRGTSYSSYRFYESMQLGVVPIMISDVDFRPFPEHIEWDAISYWVDSPAKLPALLSNLSRKQLLRKGLIAQVIWNTLTNHGWCRTLLEYL